MTDSPDEVADRLEIHDALVRYVHALDDHEYDVLDTVFMPNAVIDFSTAGGMKALWPEVKAFFKSMGEATPHDLHFFGMVLITFEDADQHSAHVKSKVINPLGMFDPKGLEHFCQIHGCYEDVFIKTPDGWRIATRTWKHGWISGDYPYQGLPGAVRKTIADSV